jgi:pilus assembly protein Flp/PilA
MTNLIKRFIREEEGQDLIEYALLAAIIALGAVVGMSILSTQINTTFSSVSGKLANPS